MIYVTDTLTAEPIPEHTSAEYGTSYRVRRNSTQWVIGNFIPGYNREHFFDPTSPIALLKAELIDLVTLMQRISEASELQRK